VLLTFVLAVTTWFGYSDQAALQKNATEAKSTGDGFQKAKNFYQAQATVLKAFAGLPLTDPEKQSLPQAYEQANAAPPAGVETKEEAGALKASLDKSLGGWNDAQKKPVRTYEETIAALRTDLESTQKKLRKAEDDLLKAKKNYDDLRTAL